MDYLCDECGAEYIHGTVAYDDVIWREGEPYCPECGHRLSGY